MQIARLMIMLDGLVLSRLHAQRLWRALLVAASIFASSQGGTGSTRVLPWSSEVTLLAKRVGNQFELTRNSGALPQNGLMPTKSCLAASHENVQQTRENPCHPETTPTHPCHPPPRAILCRELSGPLSRQNSDFLPEGNSPLSESVLGDYLCVVAIKRLLVVLCRCTAPTSYPQWQMKLTRD